MTDDKEIKYEKKIRSLENRIQNQKKLINDLISVEKNFQLRDNYLKELLANLPGMAYRCRCNHSWVVDYVSPGAIYLSEYEPIELIGGKPENFDKLYKNFDKKRVWETIQIALKEKKQYDVEYTLISKSGKEVIVGEKGIGLYDSNDELVSFEGFIYKKDDIKYISEIEKNISEVDEIPLNKINTIQDGICEIDIPKNTYHFNYKFFEMGNYDPDEFQPTLKWFLTKVHPEDLTLVLSTIRLVINSNNMEEMLEFKLLDSRSKVFWVKSNWKVIKVDENGFPMKIFVSFTNITEIKKVEESLKNNLKFVKTLLETIPVPVFYKDIEGKYRGCNKEFIAFIGIPEEKLIGKTVFDLYSKEYATTYYKADNELFIRGGVQKYEAKVKDKNNQIRDVVFYKNVYTDNNNIPAGLIGVALDITEKNRIQKELEDQHNFLESILSRLPLILWKIDKNGIFQFSEGEGLRKLGLLPGEVIGVSAYEMYAEYPELIEQFNRVLQGEKFIEKSLIDNLCFETYYTPLFDKNNNIEGALGVALDITRRAQIEEEIKQFIKELRDSKELVEKQVKEIIKKNNLLKESEDKLKKLNESKDLFFSIIAHDLKNPFHSLIGLSEMLKEVSKKYIVDDDIEIVEIINSNIKHVYNLLDELLEWAALQLGRIEYQPKLVILNTIVVNACEHLSRDYKFKQINIRINIDKELQVFVDSKMLETILRNLISNSVKFTGRGGEITITAKKENKKTIVSVKDNGVGISKDNIDKLFKIDVTHSTVGLEGEKGTGMGLILCKELVEKNGGIIWVESELNKGSNFLFTLKNSADTGGEND